MNKKTILIGLGLIIVLVVFAISKSTIQSSQNQIDKTSVTADQTTVVLTNNGFEPKTVTIKAGQTVVWKNESASTATVNSTVHPTHRDYPALNLSRFKPGESLSLTFSQAGSYQYHDHLNASSLGLVIVQ